MLYSGPGVKDRVELLAGVSTMDRQRAYNPKHEKKMTRREVRVSNMAIRKERGIVFVWENLLLNACPACGTLYEQDSGDRVCDEHKFPMKISEKKFNKIVNDIETRQAQQNFLRDLT